MEIVQLKKFKEHIDDYMSLVSLNKEEVFIANKDKAILMIDTKDYESLKETLRIYRNPYLYNKLIRAKKRRKKLLESSKELKEVFDEIDIKP